MELEAVSQLVHYGVPGTMLAVFLFSIRYLMEQHREERKQLEEMRNTQIESYQELIKENTRAFVELKNAIQNQK